MASRLAPIVPHGLTLLNLCCGVLAIIFLDLFWSPLLILLAGFFDLFDGAAARALGVTSDIGKELDSLCDMVSFGVAPACLYWLLVPTEAYYLMLGPLLIACGAAYRLAKFNTLPASSTFKGLPSPASGLFFVGLTLGVYWGHPVALELVAYEWTYLLLAAFFAFSMNRSLEMFALKGWKDKATRTYLIILGVGAAVFFALDHRIGLPASIFFYLMLCEIKGFFKDK
jgi:CDP-diacylglycerol--serine O-phosphatidyltransferase